MKKEIVLFGMFLLLASSLIVATSDSKNTSATVNVTQVNSGVLPPTDLMAYVTTDGNKNAFLNWTPSGGSDGYRIYYVDNNVTICQRFNVTHGAPNVTLVGALNNSWNDTTANLTTRRFYIVSAYYGASENFSAYCVGRQGVTIDNYSAPNYDDLFSFQLNEIASLKSRLSPSNDLAQISYSNWGVDTISYRVYLAGMWLNESGYEEDLSMTFTSGYWSRMFQLSALFASAGKVEAGSVNQTIRGGDDDFIGLESFSNISLVAALPVTNDLAQVSTLSGGNLTTRIFIGGLWLNETGYPADLNLTADEGYWTRSFTSDSNLTYVRNPY